MTESNHDRVFAPTPRKRRQARELGQVVVSPDLVSGVLLLALTGVLHLFGDHLISESGTFLRGSLEQVQMEGFEDRDEMTSHLFGQLGSSAGYFLIRLWPFWMLASVAIACVLVQTRGLIHWQSMVPAINRINPVVGMQRFSPVTIARRFFGTSLKIAGLSSIAWFWASRQHEIAARVDLAHQTQAEMDQAVMFLLMLSLGLLAWGVLDYFLRRLRFAKQLRMSARELADEQKQFDPDPAVGRQAQELRSRMAETIRLNRHTDLLITNGLADCVLLRFDPEMHTVPVIVVRQTDAAGVQLLQRCMQSRVTIHASAELQQELSLGSDPSIPERLWAQIAELFNQKNSRKNESNTAGEPTIEARVSS